MFPMVGRGPHFRAATEDFVILKIEAELERYKESFHCSISMWIKNKWNTSSDWSLNKEDKTHQTETAMKKPQHATQKCSTKYKKTEH
jgi:hypothetical protein